MIFTSSNNLTRVLMQYSIIMKVTMNSFHFSYSIFASQKLFHGHPRITVLSCSTHMKQTFSCFQCNTACTCNGI